VIQELEYDTMNNPINFINRYIMLPSNTTSTDTFSFVLDEDQLDEGYYKLSAKIALVSQFPDLVDLDGRTNIIQVLIVGACCSYQAWGGSTSRTAVQVAAASASSKTSVRAE
jgi:hypothetical protein